MQKLVIAFIMLSGLTATAFAQDLSGEKQLKAITTIVDGYNEQNYRKMQKPWFFLGKLLLTKKRLRSEFQPYFQKYGKAAIDTITFWSPYQFVAKLKMEKDEEAREFLKFNFNYKGKVEGFGFTQPTFIYPAERKDNMQETRADNELQEKIDAIVVDKYKNDQFNGCVLVMRAGQTVYKQCYGYASFETKTELNDSTRFELASCAKQFTAMAIMMLEEQGKLRYTDSLNKFIPNLPYHNITLEHLLRHTSGLPDYMTLLKEHWDRSKFATNYDIVSLLQAHQPAVLFEPGQQFSYSNTGYTLLSIVIEKVSGMSYADFMEKSIFKPLGMHNSLVYATKRSENERIANYADGYVFSKDLNRLVLADSVEKYKHVIYMDPITGDGTISSSISDLAIWETTLANHSLVKEGMLNKAYSKTTLADGTTSKYGNWGASYGYGVFLIEEEGIEPVVFHTGGWPGYMTTIMRLPNQGIAVALLTNNSYENILVLTDKVVALMLK